MITTPSRIALGASCTYPHQPHYIKKPRLMAGQRVDRDWIQSIPGDLSKMADLPKSISQALTVGCGTPVASAEREQGWPRLEHCCGDIHRSSKTDRSAAAILLS